MTDTPAAVEPPKQAEPPPAPEAPKEKRQFLDNLLVKYFLTLAAWMSPLPITIVMLKYWYMNFAPEDQRSTDPFTALHRTLTNFAGGTPDLIPFIALVPAIVLLTILHRTPVKRAFTICALVFIAVGEIIALTETWGQ